MAANKRKYRTDKTREKIRTTQLKNRLEAFALGEKDAHENPVEMSTAQVKAALGLMAKTLPDLTSADIHDSRQDESRSYEEIRIELIREHGEPLALLLLKEISQADYLKMMQADLVKQADKVEQAQPGVKRETDSKESELISERRDVAPSHSLATDSPDTSPKLLQ